MECQYCHKTFKNVYTLKTHQTKTKYCLKIQGKNTEGTYNCGYCNKNFTLQSSLTEHNNVCKANTPYVKKYRNMCTKLKKELEVTKRELEVSLCREQELREDYAKLAAISAKKPTTNTTNNLNIGVFNKTSTDIKRIVDEKYDRTYLVQGQKGVAVFTHKHVLSDNPDEPPIYVITDRSRGNGKYKISNGEVVTDIGMTGLINKVHPSIKSKAVFITSTHPNPMDDDEMMAGYHEVFEMDSENSIFRNCLIKEMYE